MSPDDRREFNRVRNSIRRIFQQLGEMQLAVQAVGHDAAGAARDAGRLERKLLNGGSGEIQKLGTAIADLEKRMNERAAAQDQRMRWLERLAWSALGASGLATFVVGLLGLMNKLGLINGATPSP